MIEEHVHNMLFNQLWLHKWKLVPIEMLADPLCLFVEALLSYNYAGIVCAHCWLQTQKGEKRFASMVVYTYDQKHSTCATDQGFVYITSLIAIME